MIRKITGTGLPPRIRKQMELKQRGISMRDSEHRIRLMTRDRSVRLSMMLRITGRADSAYTDQHIRQKESQCMPAMRSTIRRDYAMLQIRKVQMTVW